MEYESTKYSETTTDNDSKTSTLLPDTSTLHQTTVSNVVMTTGQDTTTVTIPTTTPALCGPTDIHNVPHPELCDSYYMCMGGVAIQLFCPPGEEFDPATRV